MGDGRLDWIPHRLEHTRAPAVLKTKYHNNKFSNYYNYNYDHNYHSYILHFIHCYCLYCLLPPNFDQLNSTCTTQSSSKRGGLEFKWVLSNLEHNLLGSEYMEIELPFSAVRIINGGLALVFILSWLIMLWQIFLFALKPLWTDFSNTKLQRTQH